MLARVGSSVVLRGPKMFMVNLGALGAPKGLPRGSKVPPSELGRPRAPKGLLGDPFWVVFRVIFADGIVKY